MGCRNDQCIFRKLSHDTMEIHKWWLCIHGWTSGAKFWNTKKNKKYHGDKNKSLQHFQMFIRPKDSNLINITPTIKLYHYYSLKIDDNKPKWDITAAIQNHDYRPYCAHELMTPIMAKFGSTCSYTNKTGEKGGF